MATRASSNLPLLAVIVLLFAFVAITVLNQSYITGFSVAGTWENSTEITADNSQEFITAHLIFGQAKPATNCTDGIFIETQHGQAVQFETLNETYDEKGFCAETDIIFNNSIYNEANITTITYTIHWGKLKVPSSSEAQLPADIAPEVTQALKENKIVPVAVIVETNHPADVAEAKTSVSDALETSDVQYFPEAKAYAADVTAEQVEQLANIDGIRVEAQKEFQLDLSASVPYINATKVWPVVINGQNITGKGVTVCIVDTGVNYTHVALGNCFGAGCKVLGGHDFSNNDADPMDDNGHGTHVSGIVASNDSLYRGVAPEANIVMAKAFSAYGSASSQDIANGIKWCKDNKDNFNISVVSMSFGDGGTYSATNCPADALIDPELSAAHSAGLLLIASSGNSYSSAGVSYPSCNAYVVSIGATGRDNDNVQSFSNSGDALDLLAPGASIISTARDGSFVTLSGTSMSAPHVSGLAALVIQYSRLKSGITLSSAEVESRLKLTGVNVTDSRNNITRPRINAIAAITPIITIESPLNKSYLIGHRDFNITVDSNIIAATVTINGTTYDLINDSASHWYNTTVPSLSEGNYSAAFSIISDVNNSKTVFFIVYQTCSEADMSGCAGAPQIVLESPLNNSTINRGDILNFTITDDLGVDTVLINYNGTNSTLTSPYDYSTTNWKKGVQNITVFANNTAGLTNSSFFSFNVSNSAPVFKSGQPDSTYTTSIAKPLTITANATDPDNDVVNYTIATNVVSSWTSTSIGDAITWSWTPSSTEAGSYYVQFNASDGANYTLANSSITVRGNTAPTLSLISDQTATVGTSKIITFTASDPDLSYGDSLTWTDDTSIFSVSKVDATSARAAFTPSSSYVGEYDIRITVTDLAGASASRTFTLTINSNGTAAAGNNGGLGEGLGAVPETDIYDYEKTFDLISPNTPVDFTPNVAGLDIDGIILETNSAAIDASIKIRKLTSAATPAPGLVSQYFEIVTTNLPNTEIEKFIILFSVPKTWLAQNNISKEDVYLGQLSGLTWTELPAVVLSEDDTKVRYKINTTHLSNFAIAARKYALTEPLTAAGTAGNTPKGITLPSSLKFTGIFASVIAIILTVILIWLFMTQKPGKPLLPAQKNKKDKPKKTKTSNIKEVPDFGFR